MFDGVEAGGSFGVPLAGEMSLEALVEEDSEVGHVLSLAWGGAAITVFDCERFARQVGCDGSAVRVAAPGAGRRAFRAEGFP